MNQFIGQCFYVIRTSPWVNVLTYLSFFLYINLSITCDTCREIGRQCDSLIKSVGMKRLSMTQCGCHSLDTSTTYVIERVLLCKRPSRSLRVSTQSKRLRILRIKLLNYLSPQHTCGTHLGYFHKVIHTDSPEERQTRSEGIDIDTSGNSRTQIFQSVGQGISQLDIGCSSGFLHVITRDRDRVELRHLLRSILKYIRNNFHRECRRIDISITHHELFQDIVLNSSRHFFKLSALLQSGVDIERHDRQYGTVHSHRHRHLIQWNTIEKHLHVLKRTDRNTSLTHIAHYTRMIGVVTTMRRKVERYRKTFLTRSQVTAIECVRLFSGRESGILTDSPRTEGIHHRIRTAQVRRNTCHIVQVFHTLKVFFSIDRLHLNLLRRLPVGCDAVLFLPFHSILLMESGIYIY